MRTIKLFDVTWERIDRKKDVPNKGGVYMCVLSGKKLDTILYIGISKKLKVRLGSHEIFKIYNRDGGFVYFLINTDCNDKNSLERSLINKIKLENNTPTIKLESSRLPYNKKLRKFSNKIYGRRDEFTPEEVEVCNKALGTSLQIKTMPNNI